LEKKLLSTLLQPKKQFLERREKTQLLSLKYFFRERKKLNTQPSPSPLPKFPPNNLIPPYFTLHHSTLKRKEPSTLSIKLTFQKFHPLYQLKRSLQ